MIACRDRSTGEVDPSIKRLDHAAFNPVRVTGSVLSADTNFSILVDVAVANDSQVVVVNFRQPYLRVIDRRSGAVVGMLGRGGKGPGEFITDPRIGAGDGKSIWVFEFQRGALARVQLDRQPNSHDSVIYVIQSLGPYSGPIGIDDSTVFLVGSRDSVAFGNVNFHTGSRQGVGREMHFRSDSLVTSPMRRMGIYWEVDGCRNPAGDRIVRFHRAAGRLEYLNREGAVVREFETPYAVEPEIERGELWTRKGRQRVGYGSCTASDEYVFALFSGRHERDYRPPSRYFPSEAFAYEFLHIFDWNGRLVKVVQLDPPAWWRAAIDTKTFELFGLTDEPEPAVVRYDLRSVLRK
jgi:hypothetical protein